MTEKERYGEKLFKEALGKNDAWNASQGEGPSSVWGGNGEIELEEYVYSSSLSSSDESDSSSLLSLRSTEATGSGE